MKNILFLVMSFSIASIANIFLMPFYVPSDSMMPALYVNDRVFVDRFVYHFTLPQRGQIVVFKPPSDKRIKTHDPLIKRIIAIPGDTIEIKRGQVILNGQPQQNLSVSQSPSYQMPIIRIPQNYYFLLGDNRNHSFDSHLWGLLPRKNIKGEVIARFWPPERISLSPL